MRRALALSLLIPAGCQPNPEPGALWIAPMHGQTQVDPSAALVVHVGNLQLPPDYPLPEDFIRVVDLGTGGFVEGALAITEEELRFEPDRGWEPGARYAWSVGEVEALDRAPELGIPASIYGEAVFDTRPALEVLDLAAEDGQLCAVLSRAVQEVDPADLTVTVEDQPVSLGQVHLLQERDFVEGTFDQEVSVACFPDLADVVGRSVRIWWGEEGPFAAQVGERAVADVILERRRAL